MTQTLTTAEVKQRSLSGYKWLFSTNVISVPAIYLTTFLLARTGKETLGVYALTQIWVSIIMTFVFLGGTTVIRHFTAKLLDATERGKFISTYLVMLLTAFLLCLAAALCFPAVSRLLFEREMTLPLALALTLFALLLIHYEVLQGVTSGLIDLKGAAVARMAQFLVPLPVVLVCFVFARDFLRTHTLEILVGAFSLAYILGSIFCLRNIRREGRFSLTPGWHLPPGFWSFMLTTQLATIFTFVYGQVDRIFVLKIADLAGLGAYQAVLSLQHIVTFAPEIISPSLVPIFSTLLASGEHHALLSMYANLQRLFTILFTILAIFMVAFSHHILALFGPGYADYSALLCLFSASSVIRCLATPNWAILTSLEKNAYRLSISSLQITIQLVGTFLLIAPFGIYGIVGSKIGGAILAQISTLTFITLFVRRGFGIPPIYWAAVGVTIVLVGIRILLGPSPLAHSAGLAGLALIAFWFFGKLSLAEFRQLLSLVLKRTANRPVAVPAGEE